MSEAAIQRAAVAWLRSQGCLCIKQSIAGAMGTKGWPDYLILLPGGRSFWIEFKVPGEGPTPLQEQRIAALMDLGHMVYVCCSKQQALDAYDREVNR
jgi:hypothetical protein